MTIRDFYNTSVKPMCASARLELAKLILDGISPESVIDRSDEWTDEDLRDATNASLAIASKSLGENDDGLSRKVPRDRTSI